MNLSIRPETPADLQAIEEVTVGAFAKTAYSDGTEQFIIQRLRAAGALTVSLVAECNGQMVGHLAVSPVTISDGSAGWFGLGPISVLPDHQGQGIGSQLMQAALDQLRQQKAQGCVLLGEPGFYHRFGFRSQTGLELPGFPAEYFLALPFGESLPQGVVTYHPAFEVG